MRIRILLPLFVSSFILHHSAFPQGSLTPPGPPAPTMKTLDELDTHLTQAGEKRTPISSLPFTISASGSYYLTGNLQFSAASGDAITINANDVTLDLNGFVLSSTAAVTGNAIAINGALRNIAVGNGAIVGDTTVTISGSPPNQTWTITPAGFGNGIRALSSTPINCQFSHLRISGCRTIGLSAGDRATIDHIAATLNGEIGIFANNGSSVTGSAANFNGTFGISASNGNVTSSTANSNGNNGISDLDGSVTGSTANSNQGSGISAFSGSVTSSTASSNGNNGISASSGVVAFCKASGNNTLNNGSLDINATGATRTGNNPTP